MNPPNIFQRIVLAAKHSFLIVLKKRTLTPQFKRGETVYYGAIGMTVMEPKVKGVECQWIDGDQKRQQGIFDERYLINYTTYKSLYKNP